MRRARDIPVSNAPSYVVEDETNSEEYIADELPVEQINTKVVEPIKAPETTNKNILESLIFLGSSSKDVDIGGHKFKISTLTHREHNHLMKELYKFGEGADLFTLRTLTLAFALKTVDNTPLENMALPDEEQLTPFAKKLAIIDSMQMNVIAKLYNEYNDLLKDVDSKVNGPEIKN